MVLADLINVVMVLISFEISKSENHRFTNSERQIEKSYAYLRMVCLSSCCVEISAKSEHWASNTV